MPDVPDTVREEELAALADGSLDPERRLVVMRAVESDPALAAKLADQRRVLDALAAAQRTVEAPHSLRTRLADTPARPAPARRGWWAWAVGLAAVAALAVGVVALLQRGGTPTIDQTAQVASRFTTADPPAPGDPKLLDLAVEGVAFPDFSGKFGWRAVGSRTDTVEGRRVTTVTYANWGRRIGYSIVAGAALDVPDGARARDVDGVTVHVLPLDGMPAVTWRRKGHTCVMVGQPGMDPGILAELAAWKGKGAVDFALARTAPARWGTS